ncbi:MAG: MAPEG family protein [Pseudomonadales bacterium]
MTIQLWCLLIGAVLPYVWAGVSVPFRNKQFGFADIQQPRVQGEALVDQGARVWGAQANAWEAFIVFTAANFAAYASGIDPDGYWAIAALIWVGARLLHGVFYTLGLAPLRVAAFLTGLLMSLWIFGLALRGLG